MPTTCSRQPFPIVNYSHFCPLLGVEFVNAGFTGSFSEALKMGSTNSLLRDGATAFDSMLQSWVVADPLPALLHYADRNAMAFSLEARVPYLDHRLVEFTAGLPLHLKLSPPYTKQILRQALDGCLIDKVRTRRTKLGFATPIGDWIRQKPEVLLEVLTDTALRKRHLVRPDRVQSMIQHHMAGDSNFGWDLWRLLVLELWFQGMIDRVPTTQAW